MLQPCLVLETARVDISGQYARLHTLAFGKYRMVEEVSQFKKVVKVCCIKRITPRRRHAARFVLVTKYFCTCKQVHVFCTRKQVVSQIGQSGGPLTLPLLLSVIRSQTTTFVLVSKYSNMLYQAYHTQKKQVQSFKRTSLACSAQKKIKKSISVLYYVPTSHIFPSFSLTRSRMPGALPT